ncbi:MAG: Chromosome segregation DNA-binding protein [Parcubacteria group bacterium GW2011_GWD2_43_10]|uniref:HTH cro/C1-type domain-containing protein n=3 Tax=Candidatus Vebleniibacteriota TaxID=1817921 RepID=A0A1G2Q3L5_9BACT|nr:MAG: Chromosome segregation DNA-binding protein [Parcubacteria group bacterium GW2011_GWA2_42_80]KKS82965.1 MAG: Chromosome segregation DNA-binding protein [Parcubacteria group bacterium GW2011_GWD2_43_10]KKS91970.1 MAG: Chromosome segregation DNA-binding protein [Parcubacteria group bacterium GW2011_GWE2_43_12]KKT21156.1 MAG: Chromosome segregation DNA-binding protein [Parcubacteria group bacterium GW2011_GWE1_43_8]OHA54312.1 MAG: hypothetical protein A2226_02610 [Candidatus Veblenbacteria 
MAKSFQLGKGLSALIPSKRIGDEPKTSVSETVHVQSVPASASNVQKISLQLIEPNKQQPRKQFDEAGLSELVASIKVHGILQPLVVTLLANGRYQLVVGERRWRAAQQAGLTEVPVIIRQTGEQERLELALVENIQRQNLNPLEEAAAYRRLQDEFNLTQEQVAKQVGKSRSQVANIERLLTLSPAIQQALQEGRITVGHAKVILSLPTQAEQEKFFASIVREGLPVHLAELKAQGVRVRSHQRRVGTVSPELRNLEQRLQAKLGTRVKIRGTPQRGLIEIVFYSQEELADLMSKLDR